MAESSPGLTYAKLSWLQAWHIRDETYSAALAELVNHQYRHAFAAHWGDGHDLILRWPALPRGWPGREHRARQPDVR
ncbi:Tn3 family transposase [Citrobacter freundii]|uniref:Tn3 family transposase n=1 Tax=Citrobacter freundii TaxID=546 RepID=UPI003CC7CB9A